MSDHDNEKMLEEVVKHEEKEGIDEEIDKDITAIEKEIEKGGK